MTKEVMQQQVRAALERSAGIVRRRFGAAAIDELVTARERLRLIETRQLLGLKTGFNVLAVRAALAKHDGLCQELKDRERARMEPVSEILPLEVEPCGER